MFSRLKISEGVSFQILVYNNFLKNCIILIATKKKNKYPADPFFFKTLAVINGRNKVCKKATTILNKHYSIEVISNVNNTIKINVTIYTHPLRPKWLQLWKPSAVDSSKRWLFSKKKREEKSQINNRQRTWLITRSQSHVLTI